MLQLQVLLVEDNEADRNAYLRDFPAVFKEAGVEVRFHVAATFEEAYELIRDPHRRFDLVLSDTYRGEQARNDAAVIEMVNAFRADRFCPLIVFSASAKPDELTVGAFVMWADKARSGEIEECLLRMLRTGIPQAARELHDDLDRLAGNYLWAFLEKNWEDLESGGHVKPEILSRIVRRRAAVQIAEFAPGESSQTLEEVDGLEFYLYPRVRSAYSLGEVVRNRQNLEDIRVILTPHCYLAIQPNKTDPRAEFVRVVKTISALSLLGAEKLKAAKESAEGPQSKRLRSWTTPPSGQEVGLPEGRYWYLPGFLAIPHSYCDLMQVDSLPYKQLVDEFESLAVLAAPYAESLQACWKAFDGSVGIPNLTLSSAKGIFPSGNPSSS